jgi:mRNA-degrading endonuclease RelE of RelBE toxin-antitoxin system
MEVDPFAGDVKPVKPLRGMFRRRVGYYRIIFTVDFERSTVVVFVISPRERAYE